MIGERNSYQSLRDLHSLPPSKAGFQDKSLSRAMFSMQSPKATEWIKYAESEKEYESDDWTEECQGVTTDGNHWYFSSNKEGKRAIYKFSAGMKKLVHFNAEQTGCKHVGDLDYSDGILYVALEQPAKILALKSDFSQWRTYPLQGIHPGTPSPQDNKLPWCAIHPWNGLLYSSRFDGVDEVYAYETKTFTLVKTLRLKRKINRVQGGCISKNGHLLLASDDTSRIECFTTLNGHYRGGAHVQIDHDEVPPEEMEGITIWEGISYGGRDTHIHVIVLDNDVSTPWDDDSIFFKHYTVPFPELL